MLEASDAHEALRLLEARLNVEAVVTDIEMPGTIDGLELAHRVREKSPRIAVVIVSGRVRLARQQLLAGATFLSKPFDTATGVGTLQDLMGYCSLSSHGGLENERRHNGDGRDDRAARDELWEQRGRPEGYDGEFWLQAQRELSTGTNAAGVTAKADGLRSGSGSDGPST